jgi:hypothetical protein
MARVPSREAAQGRPRECRLFRLLNEDPQPFTEYTIPLLGCFWRWEVIFCAWCYHSSGKVVAQRCSNSRSNLWRSTRYRAGVLPILGRDYRPHKFGLSYLVTCAIRMTYEPKWLETGEMDHDDPWKPHPRLEHVAMQWCSCSAEQGTRSGPRALFQSPKKIEVLCKLIMQTFRGLLLCGGEEKSVPGIEATWAKWGWGQLFGTPSARTPVEPATRSSHPKTHQNLPTLTLYNSTPIKDI